MDTYTNPVLDVDFPDPAVLHAPDGRYYAYATQDLKHSPVLNIQVVCSVDLVHWSKPAEALPTKPRWAAETQDFWAPCVDLRGNRYVMYFAAAANTGSGLGLGAATADHPLGPFVPSDRPLVCGHGFENIDPMALDDPESGRAFLYWGSGFGPIRCQELDPDRLHLRADSHAKELIFPCLTAGYQRLVEAPFVHYREPYYYLFYSGDDCFASYAVMVARSQSPYGPFETLADATGRAHSAILEGNERWGVPGHNSIITDDADQDWIVYHAVDLDRDPFRTAIDVERHVPRVMCIDRIHYHDGWPYVEGGSPSITAQGAPIVRDRSVARA